MKVKKSILTALLTGAILPSAVYADDYVDDIYFNPKKDTKVGASKKNSNYIENFSDIDVDAYNLRGQYYNSPIDTIGSKTASDEDFVYTQQIQKYYNPTIVLDNSDVLADVLENSYGNVEIVFNGVTPSFLPVYSYGWPYYRSVYDPWYWNVSFGGWYDPWYWGPSWSWGWGPSWGWSHTWGPSWGWGPGWGPSWGWGHVPGPRPPMHPNTTWSPGGNRPVRPGTGWAGSTRPGVARKPGVGHSNSHSGNAPSGSKWSIGGNHRGSYNQSGTPNRQNASENRKGYYVGSDGHRYTGNVSSGTSNRNNSSVGNKRGNTSTSKSNRSYTNSTNNTSTRSNNSSYNSRRSSGSSSSGSFGGGSHRSGGSGGGSSRGHRR